MLLAVGCWLLAVGCWLLAVGCWLLAVGCWLLAVAAKGRLKKDQQNQVISRLPGCLGFAELNSV
jgi:high-affinity Fe2+/Pb2+ permease